MLEGGAKCWESLSLNRNLLCRILWLEAKHCTVFSQATLVSMYCSFGEKLKGQTPKPQAATL